MSGLKIAKVSTLSQNSGLFELSIMRHVLSLNRVVVQKYAFVWLRMLIA